MDFFSEQNGSTHPGGTQRLFPTTKTHAKLPPKHIHKNLFAQPSRKISVKCIMHTVCRSKPERRRFVRSLGEDDKANTSHHRKTACTHMFSYPRNNITFVEAGPRMKRFLHFRRSPHMRSGCYRPANDESVKLRQRSDVICLEMRE